MCRSRLRNSKLLKTLSALVILLLGTGLGSALASAQESPDDAKEKLEEIEAEIEAGRRQQGILERQSQRARRQADALSADLIESARAIQLAEGNVSRLETRIQDLETETASKRDALLSNNENIVELIAAIERLSKRPAVLTLLKPDDALTTARSTGLMASLVPLIDERAGALRTDLEILAKIQTDLSNERFNLKNELQGLTNNQDRLAILLDERKAEAGQANQRARQLERELREFADEARSLRELIAKLEQQAANRRAIATRRDRPDAVERPFSSLGRALGDLKGQLPYPAVGPIVQRFGVQDGATTAKGIRIRARDGAQVISPYDGSVVYAGPFRNYGLLLIIDHGGGYHSLLAGFETLQSAVGQWVLMGEPVGTMPNGSAEGSLYLELRRGGQAINPLPWLQRQSAAAR
ncbi:MAG: peptidoglycan DD-metalloendopeptidase family protein [Kordiimonadaceae bacterium]|nr:peptidoglycan DD-metalloendopeptidase family protein [Kordiimonadaceae bacterium]MBO6567605.1 peptidoglycan DD-metalloendopeptidase family protein [Kordiimonadaceae bacterium]MBO6963181.1 peptidoglycan DD-metalloendopeptidase family protein [Kordiimonadaceae bacterium]